LTLSHPDKVERLILISGFPGQVLSRAQGPYLRLLSRLGSGILFGLAYRFMGRRAFRKFLGGVVRDRELITPAVVERAYRLRKDHGQAWPLWSSLTNVGEWDAHYAPRLGAITAPVLIIWGKEDRFFLLSVGEELHHSLPSSRLAVIPNAGHIPMWEQPNEVKRLVEAFLTGTLS